MDTLQRKMKPNKILALRLRLNIDIWLEENQDHYPESEDGSYFDTCKTKSRAC